MTKSWIKVIAVWAEIGQKNEEMRHIIDEMIAKARKRMEKQRSIDEIETLAYVLDPETVHLGKEIDADTKAKAYEILHKWMAREEAHHAAATVRMLHQKIGWLSVNNPAIKVNIWAPDVVRNPCLFWEYCEKAHKGLYTLAIRLFSTLANSCLSERAFSAMNFTMDSNRCSMEPMKQMKATFIFSNNKALKRVRNRGPRISWNTVLEEEKDQQQAIDDFFYEKWEKGVIFDNSEPPLEPIEPPELPSTQSFLKGTGSFEIGSGSFEMGPETPGV
jgi:hypothetical protein